MSIKPTIHKSKFKKLLTAMKSGSNLYYKENDFIASENVHISLKGIENLDELKPAIVEIFGHLEGEWILSKKDKMVYDFNELNRSLGFTSLLDARYDFGGTFQEIRKSGFSYGESIVFDNLTLIKEAIMIHDYTHFYINTERYNVHSRLVVVTDVREDDDVIPFMTINNTLKLTGNDVVPMFFESLTNSVKEDEESELYAREDDE